MSFFALVADAATSEKAPISLLCLGSTMYWMLRNRVLRASRKSCSTIDTGVARENIGRAEDYLLGLLTALCFAYIRRL